MDYSFEGNKRASAGAQLCLFFSCLFLEGFCFESSVVLLFPCWLLVMVSGENLH